MSTAKKKKNPEQKNNKKTISEAFMSYFQSFWKSYTLLQVLKARLQCKGTCLWIWKELSKPVVFYHTQLRGYFVFYTLAPTVIA